jgi:hypothetical protein
MFKIPQAVAAVIHHRIEWTVSIFFLIKTRPARPLKKRPNVNKRKKFMKIPTSHFISLFYHKIPRCWFDNLNKYSQWFLWWDIKNERMCYNESTQHKELWGSGSLSQEKGGDSLNDCCRRGAANHDRIWNTDRSNYCGYTKKEVTIVPHAHEVN